MDAIILLRYVERVLAVLLGGMSIYLGYRLFLLVPEQKEGEANLKFPGGISVFITRVGSGVFFALFGAGVIGVSLFKGIEVQVSRHTPVAVEGQQSMATPHSSASEEKFQFRGAGALLTTNERQTRADARVDLRKEIEILNSFPRYVRADLPEQDQALIDLGISRLKLLLMTPVWGDQSEGWGDLEAFEQWRKDGEVDPPPPNLAEAVKFYRLGQERKP